MVCVHFFVIGGEGNGHKLGTANFALDHLNEMIDALYRLRDFGKRPLGGEDGATYDDLIRLWDGSEVSKAFDDAPNRVRQRS